MKGVQHRSLDFVDLGFPKTMVLFDVSTQSKEHSLSL